MRPRVPHTRTGKSGLVLISVPADAVSTPERTTSSWRTPWIRSLSNDIGYLLLDTSGLLPQRDFERVDLDLQIVRAFAYRRQLRGETVHREAERPVLLFESLPLVHHLPVAAPPLVHVLLQP